MSDEPLVIPDTHQLYQTFALDDYVKRINSHYDYDSQFFYYLLGGTWQSYSSLFWPAKHMTVPEAEEAKFDLLAKNMGLRPGMRILDIGAGWGGPLTYLCKAYGVKGMGIMLSDKQCASARARAEKYGVDARFEVCPWETFSDSEGFDVVYSDECIAHFKDLDGYFKRGRSLLKAGGIFVNKELHFTHPHWVPVTRMTEVVNEVFGFTGNYRLLAEELTLLYNNDFEVVQLEHIPIQDYARTMDLWLTNMFANREAIKAIVGAEVYQSFRRYLKVVKRVFDSNALSLDIIVSHKFG